MFDNGSLYCPNPSELRIVRAEQTFQWELRPIAIVAIVDRREIDRELFVVPEKATLPQSISASDNEASQQFSEPEGSEKRATNI